MSAYPCIILLTGVDILKVLWSLNFGQTLEPGGHKTGTVEDSTLSNLEIGEQTITQTWSLLYNSKLQTLSLSKPGVYKPGHVRS